MTEPLSLYIHWPFCLAKCPYCDFNSHVRDEIPQKRFAAALRRELAHDAARLGRRLAGEVIEACGVVRVRQGEFASAMQGFKLR
ncbi:coproporphyrinogen III oxidase, partial [Gluconobacter japonicus]